MSNARRCGWLAGALLLGAAVTASASTPSVTAIASAGATNLSMGSGGAPVTRIVKVADVSVSSDGANGFTLSITSATLSKSGGTPIAFQIALVDVTSSAPTAAAFTTPSGTLFQYVGSGTQDKALYIKYSLPKYQDPGTYTAQIGLDVVDN